LIHIECAKRCFDEHLVTDEMFFGTGSNVSEDLVVAKNNARAARLAANRAMSCERCLGQQAQPPEGALSP